jgi:hypothetical protein
MKVALFTLFLAASAQAGAQSGVLVSPLPEEVGSQRALEVARQVLVAGGWTLVPVDDASIDARKENSSLRLFVSNRALRFNDQSVRARGTKQRDHRESGPQLTAVPQAEIDALRADLTTAFAGNLPAGAAKPAAPAPTQVLFAAIPTGVEPERVMNVTRSVFVGRRWEVSDGGAGALIARIRSGDTESTLRVSLADGVLRYSDRSTERGQSSQVPERWLKNVRGDLRLAMTALAPARDDRAREPRQRAKDDDPVERLRRLKGLLDGGLITQAEYDAKRAEILKGL